MIKPSLVEMKVIEAICLSWFFALLISQGLTVCDDSDEQIADVCYKLFHQIEEALVQDKGNEYRLRKAFFYAPNANPVLIKVIYNVSYAENIAEDAQLQPNYCTRDTNANNTVISVNKTTLVLGWTSSGVFTVFHPLTINFMQIQIPFVLMRAIHNIFKLIHPSENGPEAESFLWDGSYELPTLHINLHFNTSTCLPSLELFNSVLNDFNSLVSLHL